MNDFNKMQNSVFDHASFVKQETVFMVQQNFIYPLDLLNFQLRHPQNILGISEGIRGSEFTQNEFTQLDNFCTDVEDLVNWQLKVDLDAETH